MKKIKVNFQNNQLKPLEIKEQLEGQLQAKNLVRNNTNDSELSDQDLKIKNYYKEKQEEAKMALEVYDMYDYAETYFDRWNNEAFEYNSENDSGMNDDEYVLNKAQELVKAIGGRSDKKYSPEQLQEFMEYLTLMLDEQGTSYDIDLMLERNRPLELINKGKKWNEDKKGKSITAQEKLNIIREKRKFKGN